MTARTGWARDVVLDLVIGWIRVGVSLVMAFAAPLLVVQLDRGRAGPRMLAVIAAAPMVVLLGILLSMSSGSRPVAVILNMSFNVFQLAVAARGLVVLRKAVPDPRAASLCPEPSPVTRSRPREIVAEFVPNFTLSIDFSFSKVDLSCWSDRGKGIVCQEAFEVSRAGIKNLLEILSL